MITNIVRLDQDVFQFSIPPPPSAGQFASFLVIVFFVGFLMLTLIAYRQARGIYIAPERPFATLLSLLLTATTVLFYLVIGVHLILPHRHHNVAWVRDHNELIYPIDAAIGIGWYVASYFWYRIISKRLAETLRKQ